MIVSLQYLLPGSFYWKYLFSAASTFIQNVSKSGVNVTMTNFVHHICRVPKKLKKIFQAKKMLDKNEMQLSKLVDTSFTEITPCQSSNRSVLLQVSS